MRATAQQRQAASAALDKLLAEKAKEDAASAAKPCSKETAAEQAKFLRGWSKGKAISKLSPDSNFWKAGKWMTKIDPGVVSGMVKHGFAAVNDYGVLTLAKEAS